MCLKKPVADCKPLHKLIEKLASIILRAKKSSQNCELIESECGGENLRDRCVTRWNTNFKMAQRASEFTWNTTALDPSLHLDARQQECPKDLCGTDVTLRVGVLLYRMRIVLHKVTAFL